MCAIQTFTSNEVKIKTINTFAVSGALRMDALHHAAKTTTFMSTLDLGSVYWPVEMNDANKLKNHLKHLLFLLECRLS